MIRNERQYRITSRQRQVLADALDELLRGQPNGVLDMDDHVKNEQTQPWFELEKASLAGQIADLDLELQDYEALRTGEVTTVREVSLAELPDALVRARIGAGLTQRELAQRLGLKEQQIQRYEAEGYASASLSRLRDVLSALGVELKAGLDIPARETTIARLRRRLSRLGLDRRVIEQRLLRDVPDNPSPVKVLELAERAARLLALPIQQLFNEDLPLPALATTARFKAASTAAQAPLDAYTRYAESIADIVLRATQHLGVPTPPDSAQDVRAAIEQRAQFVARGLHDPLVESTSLFAATLQYLYDLRIPLVPLRDPGAFHGACFTRDGRSVIVLKQMTNSAARWLNDLLHEMDHMHDPGRGELRTWIELGDISEWSDAPEERHANDFAADVLFSGRAEPVLAQCLQAAQGSVQRLKAVVPRVAEQAEVPADVLANHLAFHLSAQGINWWPTAATFQERTTPWREAADLLLRQLDLTALDAIDRAALMDVLAT
jgi:transcriptional regulator with XRE-family HTH domain